MPLGIGELYGLISTITEQAVVKQRMCHLHVHVGYNSPISFKNSSKFSLLTRTHRPINGFNCSSMVKKNQASLLLLSSPFSQLRYASISA